MTCNNTKIHRKDIALTKQESLEDSIKDEERAHVSIVDMRILAWNCRGLSNTKAIRQLADLNREHSPKVLTLSKTRLDEKKIFKQVQVAKENLLNVKLKINLIGLILSLLKRISMKLYLKKRYIGGKNPKSHGFNMGIERFSSTLKRQANHTPIPSGLSFPYTLSDLQENLLNELPNDDEIRKSINFMGCDKALGPGGMHVAFYINHWKEVGASVVEIVLNGELMPIRRLNGTFRSNMICDFIENHQWNVEKVCHWFLSKDAKRILYIVLPTFDQEESWLWIAETYGSSL
uniref:Uncharacterized protein n=1 Tax=Cannabis sativa TaxID=3483 RepID=A0A803PEN5_CANSA